MVNRLNINVHLCKGSGTTFAQGRCKIVQNQEYLVWNPNRSSWICGVLFCFTVLFSSSDATCNKLFELKCVLAVCTQPPYNDKYFFILLNHFTFLISSHSQMPVCVTSHRPRPLPRLFIYTRHFTLDLLTLF